MTKEVQEIIFPEDIERDKALKLVDSLWDPLMDNLPSKTNEDFQKVKVGWYTRKIYIAKFGYVLLTREIVDEIEEIFDDLNIKEFVEIQAGTGFLTKVLNDRGFAGKAYSLPIPKAKRHWGLTVSKMYSHCVETDILRLIDIRDLRVKIPKMVISSWIPYKGGKEVIEFFESNSLPEYYMIIGEGYGGCTASAEFHGWLDKNYKEFELVRNYERFLAIHDNIIIYKRRAK